MQLIKRTDKGVVDLEQRRQEMRGQVLERLFNEHRSDLRAFLMARLGVNEDKGLEDVIQEVFVRLARMEQLPDEVLSGEQKGVSYMLTIAHNHVIDKERANARRRRLLEQAARYQQGEALSEATPERAAMAGEELEKLKVVIDRMRPKWRRAFVLSRMKFMSYKEIAEDMSISVKQVEKHMQNALICIRKAAIALERE